jgi:hypothetical protein
MQAEQLPVLPRRRPELPQPCIVCGDTVELGERSAYLEPPVIENEGYTCATCTDEARALFVAIRERNNSLAVRAPTPAAEPK